MGAGLRRFQDEHGLGQVELGGDGLHLFAVQRLRIEHDGERIAAEGGVGENVEGVKAVAGHEKVLSAEC